MYLYINILIVFPFDKRPSLVVYIMFMKCFFELNYLNLIELIAHRSGANLLKQYTTYQAMVIYIYMPACALKPVDGKGKVENSQRENVKNAVGKKWRMQSTSF